MTETDAETARLRWFLLAPSVRGSGIGRRLIEAAIEYARLSGYNRILLRTNKELEQARRLYAKFGFTPIESETSFLSGRWITEETWEKKLEFG